MYHTIPKEIQPILDSAQERNAYSIFIKKSLEFIEWRYSQNPEYQYFNGYAENEFFFLLKEYSDQVHLIDFFVADPSCYKPILEASIQFSSKRSKHLTLWIPIDHPLMDLVREHTFSQHKASQNFHVTCQDSKLDKDVLELSNWFYTMGDSDVY